MGIHRNHLERTYCFWDDVKQTWSSFPLVQIALPDEVFLGMACHLCWSSCLHKIPRDAPPISFPQLLKPQQEQSMLFLCPWYTWSNKQMGFRWQCWHETLYSYTPWAQHQELIQSKACITSTAAETGWETKILINYSNYRNWHEFFQSSKAFLGKDNWGVKHYMAAKPYKTDVTFWSQNFDLLTFVTIWNV
jgi:hypothetical protein